MSKAIKLLVWSLSIQKVIFFIIADRIISENKISKNLSIVVKDPLYKTQNMYLWPYSDFHKLMFELRIIGESDF
jgi:hypothetical protein